ncbi:MAG: cryptochrome/photolyase family protein [Nitrincola sp.]|nr:cryptochrome/photolyase family protein [Nitrincola sp.]
MKLRLILGDQLNASHSWFKEVDPSVIYVIAEMHQETNYVVHHIQKICAFFKAMENFASALEEAGHKVIHLTLDETAPFASITELLDHLFEAYQVEDFSYQQPDEYRLEQQLKKLYRKTQYIQ